MYKTKGQKCLVEEGYGGIAPQQVLNLCKRDLEFDWYLL